MVDEKELSLLEQLEIEMIGPCYSCNGLGIIYDQDYKTEEVTESECVNCSGSGKVLSYEAEKFRQLILTGEIL